MKDFLWTIKFECIKSFYFQIQLPKLMLKGKFYECEFEINKN